MLQLPPYWKLYAICGFVAIGGFLYGYDNGTISACLIMNDFQLTFSLDTPLKTATIVSVPMAASCMASILSGPVADTIGRQRFFLIAAVLHLIGTIIQLVGNDMATLIIGRIITGTSVGIFSFLVPLYQSEIAKPEHRGRLITLYQFGVTLGFCVAFWIGYATFDLPRHLPWQIPLGVQIGPAAIMILGLRWYVPESPRWLIYRGRKEEADVILSSLRMKGHLNDKEYQQHHHQYYHQRHKTWRPSTQQEQLQKMASVHTDSTILPLSPSPISTSSSSSSTTAAHQTSGSASLSPLIPKSSSSSSPPQYIQNDQGHVDVIDSETNIVSSPVNNTPTSTEKTSVTELSKDINEKDSYDSLETLEMEYLGIIQDVTFERMCSSTSYSALLTRGIDNYRKRTLLGIGLHIMTQFTGINAILFYLPHILESMGLAQMNSVLFGNGVSGMVNMLATIPVFFYIDRWDRRRILMTGAACMSLCMAVIAVILGIHNDHTETSNRPLYPGSILEVSVFLANESATLCILVVLCLFLTCFALSYGPVGWIYPAEIFNQLIRAKAMGVTTGSMFAFSILVSQVAPLLFRYVGWKTYVIFACLCALMVFVVRGFYPETKGKTFEEIQLLFSGALVNHSPKAHHPSTAAEAWEKVELVCHRIPILMKQVTMVPQPSEEQQQQCQIKAHDKGHRNGHHHNIQTSITLNMAPLIQKTYDTSVQQKFEAILDEKDQQRRHRQKHRHSYVLPRNIV